MERSNAPWVGSELSGKSPPLSPPGSGGGRWGITLIGALAAYI